MSESKKPQDHLPKAKPLPPAPADRIRAVTWEDHEYAVDPRQMDDIAFMELLGEMEQKPFLIAKVVAHILGPEQYEQLKTQHADDAGRLSMERIGQFMAVLNTELEALGN